MVRKRPQAKATITHTELESEESNTKQSLKHCLTSLLNSCKESAAQTERGWLLTRWTNLQISNNNKIMI